MDILIIKTSSLGDVVHALPAVNALVDRWPEAQIDFLVNPAFRDIAGYCRNLREVILFDRKRFGSFPGGIAYSLDLAKQLRRKRYDMVIDLQGLTRSAIFAGMAAASRKIGFAKPREPIARIFYNERIAVKPGHAVARNLELIGRVTGCECPSFPPLPVNAGFAAAARKLLKRHSVDPEKEKLLAVAPGARWPSKCFPPGLFCDVLRRICEKRPNTRILILGAPSEKDSAKVIAAALPQNCVDLTGETSIGEMAEILRCCRGLLCNDSGPMHIAAALPIKVFAFFGPTDPERTGPYGKDAVVLKRSGLDCMPCLKRICPIGQDSPPCWQIDPENAAKEVVPCL